MDRIIATTQPFVDEVFRTGKVVVPLIALIPGTCPSDYRYHFLDDMTGKSGGVMTRIDRELIRLENDMNNSSWSPAMFQEFWIYALFRREYAKEILCILSVKQIDGILHYTFMPSYGRAMFLNTIRDGGTIEMKALSEAFDFDNTHEGRKYWGNLESLLVSPEKREQKAEYSLVITPEPVRMTVIDFKIGTPILNR